MHDVYDLYSLVMSVELRQLRCLVAIAEAGSFTDAAIDLGISQAAASRTLASLESALGVRLLRRTTSDVTLAAAGSRVLAHARRALAAAEDVVREPAAGPARLRICCARPAWPKAPATSRSSAPGRISAGSRTPSSDWNAGTAPWRPTIRGRCGARCGWPRSASGSWSSTGAPARPSRICGRRGRA